MSSGKSRGSHSGPYGAAVITSFCWFSGNSAPSRKFIVLSCRLMRLIQFERVVADAGRRDGLERRVPLDAGALHLSMARRIVHDRVVLGGTVVPERDAVRCPAPAHLIFGDLRLGD